MKQLVTLLLVILIFTNCSNENNFKSHEHRELLPHAEKYEHDGYLNKEDTLISFIPDITIGEIKLLDVNNIDEYLGVNSMEMLTRLGENEDFPHLEILSNNGKQKLTVYFHPGSVKKEFSEFKISYNKETNRTLKTISTNEFKTESNIKLGITLGDLKTIKGEPDSISLALV